MKDEMGVWINYRQAVVVIVPDLEPEGAIKHIKSSLEKPVLYSGALTLATGVARDATTGKDHDSRVDERVSHYLDDVIFYLADATSILILGPGATKFALQKRLEARKLGDSIVAIKTTGRLTHRQIAIEVRQYFAEVRQQAQAALAVPTDPHPNAAHNGHGTAGENSPLHFSDEEIRVRHAENRPVTASGKR